MLIGVETPLELSYFVAVGINLAVALCSADTLGPARTAPAAGGERSARRRQQAPAVSMSGVPDPARKFGFGFRGF